MPRRKPKAFLRGFGEKSADNIVSEIAERKKIGLERFIYSLGILHIGAETAVLLAQQLKIKPTARRLGLLGNHEIRIKDLIGQAQKWTFENLQTIRDIGPRVAQSIYDWFHNSRNIKFLEKLERVGVKLQSAKRQALSDEFRGLTFVLTGVLRSMSRDEAKAKIRELEGHISESVSRKTDFVVAGSEPGSKYEKAKELKVKILSEQEFLKMLKKIE